MDRELIKRAWRQSARAEDDWINVQDSRAWQVFYTFKAIICIALNLEVKGWNPHLEMLDCIRIADWDFTSTVNWEYGPGCDWQSLYVGYGLFRNWRYYTISDGYP